MSLRADAVTTEVTAALRAAGVSAILLRGPALASWLYEMESERGYGDVDLLVAPAALHRTEDVLSERGFVDRTTGGVTVGDRPTHAHTWIRDRDEAVVDLHLSLLGIGVGAAESWSILERRTETLSVRGTDVHVLQASGRALVVALHAAAHGALVGKPLEDLRRAVARLPHSTWVEALALAEQLDAVPAFAAGLRLIPAGDALAARLDLPHETSIEVKLRAATAPPTALGFEWLAQTQGRRAKGWLVLRKLAPAPAFMRAWTPLARRGRVGLAAAYIYRALWLAKHAGPGFIAWARLRNRLR